MVSINDIFSQVIQNDDGEFAHPFYNRARALLLENNYKELIDQRVRIYNLDSFKTAPLTSLYSAGFHFN